MWLYQQDGPFWTFDVSAVRQERGASSFRGIDYELSEHEPMSFKAVDLQATYAFLKSCVDSWPITQLPDAGPYLVTYYNYFDFPKHRYGARTVVLETASLVKLFVYQQLDIGYKQAETIIEERAAAVRGRIKDLDTKAQGGKQ